MYTCHEVDPVPIYRKIYCKKSLNKIYVIRHFQILKNLILHRRLQNANSVILGIFHSATYVTFKISIYQKMLQFDKISTVRTHTLISNEASYKLLRYEEFKGRFHSTTKQDLSPQKHQQIIRKRVVSLNLECLQLKFCI